MIRFQNVHASPLMDFNAVAPDAAVIGLIGLPAEGPEILLRLAAGVEQPLSGTVTCTGPKTHLHPPDALQIPPTARALIIDQTFAQQDALTVALALLDLSRLRASGATVLLYSHDQQLLAETADEIWWLQAGRLARQGGPREVLDAYLAHIAEALRAAGNARPATLSRAMRRGDGRATIERVELLAAAGQPTSIWSSGETAEIKVTVLFHNAVSEPVLGILIRTRIGLDVYGTNTELEHLKFGPFAAGTHATVSFRFPCDLCPGEYTLTVASHDPDGVWHEWLEDAVAFSVAGDRFTAGVANLRAKAALSF